MDKHTGSMIGASLGTVAAAATFAVTGPFGLLTLASTLTTINAAANLGGIIAEAANSGSAVSEAVNEAKESIKIKIVFS